MVYSDEMAVSLIEAVLFDYGVVLSGPADAGAWARMREITGLDEAQFHAAYWTPRHDYDRGFYSGRDYWAEAGRQAGLELGPAQVEALIEADTQLWTGRNEPMIAWAARLQAAGTRTGILSNLGDEMTHGVLRRQGWLAGFDFLLWSHALGMAKPEAEIYRRAAEGMGVEPAQILFVDDRENNVAGGDAARMQTMLYTTQTAFEAEMGARGLEALWLRGRETSR